MLGALSHWSWKLNDAKGKGTETTLSLFIIFSLPFFIPFIKIKEFEFLPSYFINYFWEPKSDNLLLFISCYKLKKNNFYWQLLSYFTCFLVKKLNSTLMKIKHLWNKVIQGTLFQSRTFSYSVVQPHPRPWGRGRPWGRVWSQLKNSILRPKLHIPKASFSANISSFAPSVPSQRAKIPITGNGENFVWK